MAYPAAPHTPSRIYLLSLGTLLPSAPSIFGRLAMLTTHTVDLYVVVQAMSATMHVYAGKEFPKLYTYAPCVFIIRRGECPIETPKVGLFKHARLGTRDFASFRLSLMLGFY